MIVPHPAGGNTGDHSQHQPATTASRRATVLPPRPVEPGAYDGEIVDARLVGFEWRKSPTNPDGLTLRVQVYIEDDRGAAEVFDAVDVTNSRRLSEIAACCGLTDASNIARMAANIIGTSVRITTRNIVPKAGRNAGREKAVISSWL